MMVTREMILHNTSQMWKLGEIILREMFSQEFDRYLFSAMEGIIYP